MKPIEPGHLVDVSQSCAVCDSGFVRSPLPVCDDGSLVLVVLDRQRMKDRGIEYYGQPVVVCRWNNKLKTTVQPLRLEYEDVTAWQVLGTKDANAVRERYVIEVWSPVGTRWVAQESDEDDGDVPATPSCTAFCDKAISFESEALAQKALEDMNKRFPDSLFRIVRLSNTQKEVRNSGLIAGIGVTVSGLSMALSGISFMLNAFRTDGSMGWSMLVVICGVLICAGGGFIMGCERE